MVMVKVKVQFSQFIHLYCDAIIALDSHECGAVKSRP